MSLKLTPRDQEVLRFLAAKKAASLDVLASRFFAADPRTGKPSKSPLRACLRRLGALRSAGHVTFERLGGPVVDEVKPSLVYLAPSAARRLSGSSKKLHPRHRDHQVQTMRACERIRDALIRQGAEAVEYSLETELLAEAYSARSNRDGVSFDAFPDAVLHVTSSDGVTYDVAVEYVTSSYSDAQISDKASELPKGTAWYADTEATAQRVARLTGAACRVV